MTRLLKHIRLWNLNQNRFSKYFLYALGEIVLVVIGILIALSINNWNEERKDRIAEQKILNILKSEFNYNLMELERNIQKASQLKQRADSIIILISNREELSRFERFPMLVNGLSAYSTFDPSNGGLNNIINSGKLDIIQSDSLKLKLSRWFGEVQDIKEDEVRAMDFGDSYITPLRIKFTSIKHDSKYVRDTAALLNNPEFENIVHRFSRAIDYIIENYLQLNKEIQSIMALINNQIKND